VSPFEQEHKVLVPAEEQIQRCSRRSIAFFVHPNNDVMIEPLDDVTSKYEPITAKQYLDQQFAKTYQYWYEFPNIWNYLVKSFFFIV